MAFSAAGNRGTVGELVVTDVTAIPLEPPDELLYSHRPQLGRSALSLLRRADVIYTLAERDIRAQYKQAVLGVGWALLNPVATLVIFTLVFSGVKKLNVVGEPYVLFSYVGILSWGFFQASVAGASNSLLTNKLMMAKTHFPRECFPLAQVLQSAFTTMLGCVPLLVLFGIEGFTPKLATLWVPLYAAVEIPFAVGAALIVSSVIIQMRDLSQVVPTILPLGLMASPVVWPFSKIPAGLRPVYSIFNPVGPVIDGIRRSMLLGHSPDWTLIGIAMCGSLLYLLGGYALFKRLEVSFADLA